MKTQKIAVITGGSRGLGRSMVTALAEKGINVVFTYHTNAQAAQDVINTVKNWTDVKAVALPLNVENTASFTDFEQSLRSVLDAEFKRSSFDFLVNNAGVGINKPIEQLTEVDFDRMVSIHAKAPYFLTNTLLDLIEDEGRIINISSGLTRFALPGFSAYAMMKSAIEVFTRYLALELKDRRIRVNTVAPGAIETDFGDGLVRDNQPLNEHIAGQTALGRVGQADDIGGVISTLLSKESGWINGQRIEVSGGIHL
ncbi:SDR family oxidoreductase [Sessilibacter sp. MAH1]